MAQKEQLASLLFDCFHHLFVLFRSLAIAKLFCHFSAGLGESSQLVGINLEGSKVGWVGETLAANVGGGDQP